MSCPTCLVALSSPDGITVRRSQPLGDQPPTGTSVGSMGVFVLSAAAAFLVLTVAMPAAAKRATR